MFFCCPPNTACITKKFQNGETNLYFSPQKHSIKFLWSLWDERLLRFHMWQMHVREGPPHHKNSMAKGSFSGPSGAQCVFCHICKSQYFQLTSLQLQIKGQVYICAHSNTLSLELTINATFKIKILIATLTLLETSLSLWHNLDVHRNRNKVLFSSKKSEKGRGGETRGILTESRHTQHKLSMDSPATSAWSSSSRFRTQRRKQLVPCRWTECRLSLIYLFITHRMQVFLIS